MPAYDARERSACTGVGFYTVRDSSRPVRGQFAAQFAAQFAGAICVEIYTIIASESMLNNEMYKNILYIYFFIHSHDT